MAGVIFPLFPEQGIIVFLEVGPIFLEVGPGMIDLVTGHPVVGALIHIIMILLHREVKHMMVGMVLHTEAEDLKGAEVTMTRPTANHAHVARGQITIQIHAGKQQLFLASPYPLSTLAAKITLAAKLTN